MRSARAAATAAIVLATASCSGGGDTGSQASGSCPRPALSVHVPGLDTSTGTPTIRLGQRTPAVTTLWLADYATPDPTSPVDPDRPAPPDGGVRVRLDLFSLDSKGLADGAVLPAASDSGARLRSSALIETHDSLHGEYLDVTGQVELVKAGERVCGTFRIGDDDEWAQGSFDVEAPR